METPFFSIIIPTYNRASFIEETLASVLAQSFQDFEVIVVDDGGKDDTAQRIENLKDPRVQYFWKENEERGASRNYGAKRARGKYLYFLDSDDLLYVNHLQTAFDYIENNHWPALFFQPYEMVDAQSRKVISKSIPTGSLNEWLVKKGNIMSCHGVFLKKEVALANPFNEDRKMAGAEDYELWLRLAARYEIPYLTSVTSALLNHDSRSVLTIKKEKLVQQKTLFLKYLFEDQKFVDKYGNYRPYLEGHAWSYVALHLALTGSYKKETLYYLWKAIKVFPPLLLRKRCYATLKHFILS